MTTHVSNNEAPRVHHRLDVGERGAVGALVDLLPADVIEQVEHRNLGIDCTRTGGVLMNRPMMESLPLMPERRHPRVDPNTTSVEPENAASTSDHAVLISTGGEKPCVAWKPWTLWLSSSSMRNRSAP